MSRRDLVKKALGITVYPWSSDDELEEVSPTGNENLPREPPSEPRPSVADMPGTSGLQPRASLHQQQQQTSPSKRSQDRADRELFWSILNGPPRLGLPAHLSSRSGVLSRVTHTPAAELRERPERSAVADMQRILAIKRLTRNLGSMRRTVTGVIPVTRVNSGTILPSEANSAHRIDRTSSGIQRSYSARIGSSRIVGTRSPGQSRSSRIRLENRPRHNHNVTPMITPVELDDDAMNMSLQSTAAQDVSDEGNPDPEEPSEGEGSSNNLSLDHLSLEAPAPARAGEGPEQLELTEGAGAEPPPPEAGPSSARFDDYRGNTRDENMVTIDLDMLQPDSLGRSEPANPSAISEQVGRQTTSELNQSTESETSPQSTSQGVKRKRKDSNDSGAESFTVKDFNQKLLRLLECPVCLEWMEPPISQCRRGHLVCGRCRTRLACCPVCRIAFSSVRNRAMEGVAEMLRYPCRHGCGREVRLRRRAPHEANCLARKYHCPAPLCANGQPLPHAALAQHFQSPQQESREVPPQVEGNLPSKGESGVDDEEIPLSPEPQNSDVEQTALVKPQRPYWPYVENIRGRALTAGPQNFRHLPIGLPGGRPPPPEEGRPLQFPLGPDVPFLENLRRHAVRIADADEANAARRADEAQAAPQNEGVPPFLPPANPPRIRNIRGQNLHAFIGDVLPANPLFGPPIHFPYGVQNIPAPVGQPNMFPPNGSRNHNVQGVQGFPCPHAGIDRIQSKHLPLIKIGCKHKFSMKVNLEQHDNWLILAMGQYFHLKIDVDVHTCGVIVYVSFIGPKCDAKNYTYEVTVDGQYNKRKITYARSTHSDLESSSLTVNRQDCFHLTLDQALNFIRNKNRHCTSNKFLDFNVEIARVENATQQDSDS